MKKVATFFVLVAVINACSSYAMLEENNQAADLRFIEEKIHNGTVTVEEIEQHINALKTDKGLSAHCCDAIARGCCLYAIKAFLRHGADVNYIHSNGFTPLVHAIIWGNPESMQLLLQWGAKVEAVNDEKISPLRYTCLPGYPLSFKDERKMKMLLIYGASPYTINKGGLNCIDVLSNAHKSICGLGLESMMLQGTQHVDLIALHTQAQALLAFKGVAAKKGERYVRNVDGKFVGKRDENGAVQLKTVYMDNLSIPLIKNIFEQAGFVYPHRRKIEDKQKSNP